MLHLNYIGKEIPTVDKLSVNFLSTATLDISGVLIYFFYTEDWIELVHVCNSAALFLTPSLLLCPFHICS